MSFYAELFAFSQEARIWQDDLEYIKLYVYMQIMSDHRPAGSKQGRRGTQVAPLIMSMLRLTGVP